MTVLRLALRFLVCDESHLSRLDAHHQNGRRLPAADGAYAAQEVVQVEQTPVPATFVLACGGHGILTRR